MKDLDVRGLSCPMPVVAVKKALEAQGGELRVLLDDGAPRENVRRFVESRGFTVSESPLENGFALTLSGGGLSSGSVAASAAPQSGPVVMMIASDRLGDGPEELGRLLMRNFLMTLKEVPQLPDRILFLNTGVLLAAQGSEVLEALEALGNLGVEVLSCGICLDFFQKKDQLAAGAVGNMFTVAESLTGARLVLRI